MSEFSSILRNLRRERNLSQQELADKLGISKSTVSMYERGERRPSFDIAEAITEFFGVDLSFLIGSTDKIKRPSGDHTDLNHDKYLSVSLEEIELVEAWRHADAKDKRIAAYALGLKELIK